MFRRYVPDKCVFLAISICGQLCNRVAASVEFDCARLICADPFTTGLVLHKWKRFPDLFGTMVACMVPRFGKVKRMVRTRQKLISIHLVSPFGLSVSGRRAPAQLRLWYRPLANLRPIGAALASRA